MRLGNRLLISANEKNISSITSGKGMCYLYELDLSTDTWNPIQTIKAEVNYSSKEFGIKVILDDENIIIGDANDNGADQNLELQRSGAAHIFEIPQSLSTTDNDIENKSIVTYPNPVRNVLYIQSQTVLKECHITITDVLGRIVYTNPNTIIDGAYEIKANFSQGTYILRLVVEGKIYTTKLIKR
ncbi:T9SS type A sorting domain-containing protein [Lacinutrix neustonica]|uniref:T9SS type A sorting domain-containing protein n=1 Tax=Lacinutrix neustonica TaxID=2980107 RepID=A0A9E8MXA9_9FLAO|nr:T9SS type A sorting domain-containing protein [Lacinutrix neustonica]WAC02716.1 T9SS type A sorting domain-containing protein [Lacinutrix neustonica]